MSKKNKVSKKANIAKVEETPVTVSDTLVAKVLSEIPGIEETKQKLAEYMASEVDHKTAKSIISNYSQMEMDAVEQLELQINTFKDKDRVNLAEQKLELVNRYITWKEGAEELRAELESTYSVLDSVIAKLKEYRGVNSQGNSGTKTRQACIISLTSDNSIVGEYPSLNNAVDNLIDKSERSQVFLKDGKGKNAPFKYDEEGNMIPVLDKNGNPTYYSMRAEVAKATLEKKGYIVTIK